MKISVCIPAYKNADFLDRNLYALAQQQFQDFEVILSDDSPDDSVAEVAKAYEDRLHIRYFKNSPALGTPANWNFAMQQANGAYIKLMHDDDWLAGNDSLQKFYDSLEANPLVDFCFSAFHNVDLNTGKIEQVFCSAFLRRLLKKDKYNLFKYNFIGPPSVVFQRNNRSDWYDDRFKWLVDFEGYIRFLGNNSKFTYIDECLVNIGISGEQVTSLVQHDAKVVIPESLLFLEKHGERILRKVWVFDYYWRMLRNFSVKNNNDINAAGWEKAIPLPIKKMIALQKNIPAFLLKLGPVSKLLMFYQHVFSKR